MANEIHSLKIGSTTYPIQPEYSNSAGKVNRSLNAGTKSYDGSSEVTITASDLGLSSALKYIGTSSTKVSDGGAESPTINGSIYNIPDGTSGQVVFYDGKEFVWNGSQWEFLGDDRNFKVIQSPVSDPVAGSETSTTFIDAISQDANGLITATKKRLPSYLSTSGGTISSSSNPALTIKRNNGNYDATIGFENSEEGLLGYIGISGSAGTGVIRPFYSNGINAYDLIHSGNIGSQTVAKANSVYSPSNREMVVVNDSSAVEVFGSVAYDTYVDGKTLTFRYGSSYTPAMTIASDGAVTMASTLSVGGNTTITGTCSASSGFFETSDERLKDFEDDINIDLNALKKIPKKYFRWKEDSADLQIGTSAQAVKELYPEIVNENEEGILSVDYAKLSVIALAAVDELNNELNTLKDEIKQIKAHLKLI